MTAPLNLGVSPYTYVSMGGIPAIGQKSSINLWLSRLFCKRFIFHCYNWPRIKNETNHS